MKLKGGELLMWKIGYLFVKVKLCEMGVLLVGEMSGYVFFKDCWYGFDDGLYMGVCLLEIFVKMVDLSVLFNSLLDVMSMLEL